MYKNRFRVLAVDDDPDLLDLMKMSLEADYDVIALSDPAVALDFLDYIEPDIAVLDIMMPKITGYHMVEDMRDNSKHADVKIIFLSAKNSPHDIRYGYKLGVNYYLTKPFMPDRLRRTAEIVRSESGLRQPRSKSWNMQEVEHRLQMKVPQFYDSWEEYQISRKKMLGNEALQLRRPLAERKGNWEG